MTSSRVLKEKNVRYDEVTTENMSKAEMLKEKCEVQSKYDGLNAMNILTSKRRANMAAKVEELGLKKLDVILPENYNQISQSRRKENLFDALKEVNEGT
jgi:hypothetical protein